MDDKALRDIVRFAAARAPFYRALYARRGVDLSRFEGARDLPRLPLVTPQDLIADQAGFRAEGVRPYRVSSSSGTGKHPKTLYRTAGDTQSSVEVMVRLFSAAGLREGDRLIIGQPFDLAHLGYLSLEACREVGALAVPVGLGVPDERLLQMIVDHEATAVFTSPSRMAVITGLVEAVGLRGRVPLRVVLLAGERLHPGQARRIEEFWGIQPHNLYGSEETDGLGGTCGERRGFHFMSDRFVMELLRPGTDEPVGPGEDIGEAVITSLYAQGTPLVRYRLGDIVERVAGPCPCGRPWPLIRVRGRATDTLQLYDGIKLHAFQIEAMLEEILPAATGFQAVCRAVRPGLEEVELRLDAPEHAVDAALVERHLWASSLDLAASRDIGSLRFKVTAAPGQLETTARGKTPKILDLRVRGA